MWILLNSHPLPHTKTHNFQQYLFKAPIFSGSEHCPHIPQLLSSNLIPQNPLTLPFMCLFLVYFLIFLQTLHYRSLRISVAFLGAGWDVEGIARKWIDWAGQAKPLSSWLNGDIQKWVTFTSNTYTVEEGHRLYFKTLTDASFDDTLCYSNPSFTPSCSSRWSCNSWTIWRNKEIILSIQVSKYML